MRRILGLTSIVFLLSVGSAFAGHGGGGHGGGGGVVRDHRAGGPVVRDHRGGGPVYRGGGPAYRGGGPKYVRVSGGRYMFPGGVVRVVNRPVIRAHYYNMRVRPGVIVETYDPVPGYVWVGGNWRWGGAEWVWVPGYFSVDEGVSGGVSVSAGVTIH